MKKYMLVMGMMVVWLGCGVERKYEDYHLPPDWDLTLTQQNHPHGFRQTKCFYCHIKANIHEVDRIGHALFPSAKPTVDAQGESSCSTCHGTNGN
ncbi:MAG: hypothetical protein A2Z91_01520 [Deltaproteobacteria bacterium GWA2_38_16]|nr:MAG: hypothetical protein A2Z91_01520 [Deltaproteobacteria bacterium GWA2_38_16]OGQ03308.1 MAG: hypothetical protein A3D19_00165 [Deltaproteobacteria bacterium RIFCSPHIGHO2_02_FULL_38_15]OGQ30471.1 MAG: hypothetical protein A3A72_08770 [Deltaproteobacteria bacterium RIFCSPLOWO2_01_FULL_38_9]OGQ63180.1 MAG: hypothetical protein A3G92_03795 [Deltaproteobacteria bacterium RIFCSPLOWO2_12_FULL_38_8]HBQ22021.1 hypothetical protein [Deltaproteobacteria bacterium]